jgi:hypothetical protein
MTALAPDDSIAMKPEGPDPFEFPARAGPGRCASAITLPARPQSGCNSAAMKSGLTSVPMGKAAVDPANARLQRRSRRASCCACG